MTLLLFASVLSFSELSKEKPEDVGVNVLVREIGEDRVKSIEVRGDILLINLHDEEAPQQKVKKEFGITPVPECIFVGFKEYPLIA